MSANSTVRGQHSPASERHLAGDEASRATPFLPEPSSRAVAAGVDGLSAGTVPEHAARSAIVHVLDGVIAAYVLIVTSVAIFGGFRLGFVSATSVAKPLLLLTILVPTRCAIGGASWFTLRGAVLLARVRQLAVSVPVSVAVRDTSLALLVTQTASFMIAFVANILLVPKLDRPFAVDLPWRRFAETFAVWDSGWYFDIATRGYYFDPSGPSSIAFFPLYPFLVTMVAAPFGGGAEAVWGAAIAVSWAAFFGALVALHGLTMRLTGNRAVARRTVFYIVVFPFSIYFTRVFTESLFLLLTVTSVRAALDSRWARAGALGALAALTRPNGILIALPLVILALAGRPAIAALGRRLAWLALVPAALVAFSAYVYTVAGSPLAWLNAQQHWGYSIGHLPYRHLLSALSAIEEEGLYEWLLRYETAPFDFFYAGVALLFLALVPAIVRRFGWAFGVYVLVSVLVPLTGNALVGMGRYASVLFPAFMLLGTVGSPRAIEAILVVSAMFRTLFLVLLVAWYPLH